MVARADALGGQVVGESVLNDLDPGNLCCGFRIWISGASGRGLGTEAVRLSVGHAFAVGLHRVELDLHAVAFMNSAGMAVLVQALRMTSPRAIELVLVGPTPAVIRPLQLSGLWHRFPVLESAPGERGDADS